MRTLKLLFPDDALSTLDTFLTLQRYLMGCLMKASFPMREIRTVMTLLHARYELEGLIRMENFQGQDHLQ